MARAIRHKKTQLPIFMSVALDRMSGSILVTDRTLSLVVRQPHFDKKTRVWQEGITYRWEVDERLLFLGIETAWSCPDGTRRRGYVMLMTPAGVGYIHTRDMLSIRLFSGVESGEHDKPMPVPNPTS